MTDCFYVRSSFTNFYSFGALCWRDTSILIYFNDVESVLVVQTILRIGAVLVFGLGAIITLLKYLLTKKRTQTGEKEQ